METKVTRVSSRNRLEIIEYITEELDGLLGDDSNSCDHLDLYDFNEVRRSVYNEFNISWFMAEKLTLVVMNTHWSMELTPLLLKIIFEYGRPVETDLKFYRYEVRPTSRGRDNE